jgi:hypothetical protein
VKNINKTKTNAGENQACQERNNKMKGITKFVLTLAAATVLALTASSAGADAPLRAESEPVTSTLRGPGGSVITSETPLDTPLWDSRFGNPAVAPDGHQITLGEWLQASADAAAKCVSDGTHVTVHLSGLIPKGVYSIWVLIFNGPFPAASPGKPFPFGNLVGAGALGPNDGSANAFQASASGEGQISAMMPTGLLSDFGPPFLNQKYDLEGCLLDEVLFHLVAVYHFDGQSYGPVPGYQHGAVEQLAIPFEP